MIMTVGTTLSMQVKLEIQSTWYKFMFLYHAAASLKLNILVACFLKYFSAARAFSNVQRKLI